MFIWTRVGGVLFLVNNWNTLKRGHVSLQKFKTNSEEEEKFKKNTLPGIFLRELELHFGKTISVLMAGRNFAYADKLQEGMHAHTHINVYARTVKTRVKYSRSEMCDRFSRKRINITYSMLKPCKYFIVLALLYIINLFCNHIELVCAGFREPHIVKRH